MPDDLELLERFAPLAEAVLADPTPVESIHDRGRRRLRRHRLAGAGLAALVVLVGITAAVAWDEAPNQGDLVRTTQAPEPGPTSTSLTTHGGIYGSVFLRNAPKGMSFEGCGVIDKADLVTCSLGIPTTPMPDGINIAWGRTPAPQAVWSAWERRDADAVATAAVGKHDRAQIGDLGGMPVIALGETDRVPGASVGREDRVTRTYVALVEGHAVQLYVEGATEAQVADVLRGLRPGPQYLGFEAPTSALPDGSTQIAQAMPRLWYQPDRLHPERSSPEPGDAGTVVYQVSGKATPLSVTVVRGIDAGAYLSQWAERERTLGRPEPTPIDGRRSGWSSDRGSVALTVDPETVILVDGPPSLLDQLVRIGESTSVDR